MFKLPFQLSGHSVVFGNSQVSLGRRNFLFAAIVTTVKPVKPPIIDGNSGPIKIPARRYGIVKLKAAKIQNLNMESPSVQDLFDPKKSSHYHNK